MKRRAFFIKMISLGLAFALLCASVPVERLHAEPQSRAGQQDGEIQGSGTADGETAGEKPANSGTKNDGTEKNGTKDDGTQNNGVTDSRAEHDEESQNGDENGGSEASAPEIIEIGTSGDFLDFVKSCSLDSWSSDKQVVLTADIDLSGMIFDPVPIFTGAFNGQNHTISGFRYGGDGYVAGLFRYIGKDGLVENLKLEGEIIAADEKECIGSLCGVNYGTIKNCSFQGTVSGKTTVGGLVGVNDGTGMIRNSSVTGRVTGYYSTGGIAGRNHGTISYCINRSCINNDSEWVEEDDEMGAGLFLSIDASGSDTTLFSGVDTGGIAGHSDGTVIRCINYGKIGYEHAGYNIGGIVGRQSGVVSLCTNNGPVAGRKDVGGIVGQMEPYIEVDEAESLRNAVNKLHDLIEKTLDDLGEEKNVLKQDLDGLTAYGDGAVDAGDALAEQIADFADNNLDQAQALADRLDHVTDMLPEVFDDVHASQDRFSDMSRELAKIGDGLKTAGDGLSVSGGNLSQNIDELIRAQQDAALRVDEIIKEIQDGGGAASKEQIDALAEALGSMSEATTAVLGSLSGIAGDAGGQVFDQAKDMGDHMTTAMDHLQEAVDSIKSAARDTNSIVDYVNGQEEIRFSKLGEEFDVNREVLHSQLSGISDAVSSLSGHASDYSDVVNEDLRAVNDQINVVFNLLADHLTNYGEFSVEELYEDVDIENPESIATGKTDNCRNKGMIRGDINVGGIAGAMSIDEEDPEDSAAGSVEYQIGRKYFTKCLITDSVNEGFVTAKKDGAGGIVGYMRHGIVTDSEGYGSVESTEGDYVGGICGESLTVIRNCYALCTVSGGRNVGGIAGFADTLKNCYSMADCQATVGRKGAIAGQTMQYDNGHSENEEEGTLKVSDNYFVSDRLCGIDDVSYVGVAEPIDYTSLLEVEGLPGQFRHLKVIFRVEDRYLGAQELKYGESLANLDYPPFPEKEGYYGVWPDYAGQVMTGNLLIDGEYKEDVTVVQSNELKESESKEGEDTASAPGLGRWEKPYALVEQRFTEDTKLTVSVSAMAPPAAADGQEHVLYDIALENAGVKEGDSFAVRLYNPYEDAWVWGYQNGVWTELESKVRGQYLQVEMTGTKQSFCVVQKTSTLWVVLGTVVGGAAAMAVLALAVKELRQKKRKKAEKKGK